MRSRVSDSGSGFGVEGLGSVHRVVSLTRIARASDKLYKSASPPCADVECTQGSSCLQSLESIPKRPSWRLNDARGSTSGIS